MACGYYSIVNTGSGSATVDFTSCNASPCNFVGFEVPSGQTYYVTSDGTPTLVTGSASITLILSPISEKFNFSGSCGDNFFVYCKSGIGPVFEIGKIYCMSAVTQCSPLNVIPTQCFEFIGTGENGYPEYSTHSSPSYDGVELSVCELSCPCAAFCPGNLITNGTFDTDLSGWTVAPYPLSSWIWSSGGALYTGADEGGYLSQNVLTENCNYSISFDLTITDLGGCGSGSVTISAGTNTYGPITTSSAVTVNMLCSGGTQFSIFAVDLLTCVTITVDNVCVTLIDCLTPTPTPTQTPTPTPTPSPSSPPLPCTVVNYCLQGTGYDFDGVYSVSGDTYNGYNFYYNEDLTYFIYFSLIENQWCLSSSPGGTCLLSGKSPCTSICPDLCDEYFSSEICPTPTPTPTINCDVFNFEAIFDCMVTPTASVTPTVSSTPTPTPTPSETPLCPFIDVDATIEGLTPTPSPTSTPTPTPSGVVDRPCSLSGDVTFNTINADIKCPVSFEFQDCYNGMLYYTTSDVVVPSGGTLVKYMVFESVVDGQEKCITYIGSNTNVSGVNVIELTKGPVGYSNSGGCGKCFIPENSPTPTPTPTPTPVFCFCYTAFNNSKLGGGVEWVDCSGNTQTVSIPLGVSYSLCSSIPPIVYGDIIIGTNGICGEGNICSENNCFTYEIQNTDPSLDIVVSWFDCCKQIQSEISLKPGEFNEVNSSYNPIVTGGSYNIFVVSISPCN